MEQAGDAAGLERRAELARIDEVVLDRVARAQDGAALEPGNPADEARLHVFRQRGRDAVGIDRVVVEPLGFEKDLVARTLGEAHHLVLDRGAVARPGTLDAPGIDRRAVEIGADRVVDALVRPGDVAVDLRRGDPFGEGREGHRRVVSGLAFETFPVDGAPVEPGRRAGFEPAEREPGPLQGLGEADRRRIAHPPGRAAVLADMDRPAQERARRQHHGAGADGLAGIGHHAVRLPALPPRDVLDRGGDQVEPAPGGEQFPHRGAVERPVGLGARPPHRRPLAPVEDAELDPGAVDGAGHDPVERVDLAHQMALAEPADRRVAGHLADPVEPVGDQRRPRPHPRSGGGRLAPGMAAADHDHVVCPPGTAHGAEFRVADPECHPGLMFHVKHRSGLLPNVSRET